MIRFLIIVNLIIGFSQRELGELNNSDWQMVTFSDPFFDKTATINESNCLSKVKIRFEKKGNFRTIINDKWEFFGKFNLQNQGLINISPGINEKIYQATKRCDSDSLSTVTIKVMFANTFKYEIVGDTLRLTYKKNDNKDGIIDFYGKKL